MNFIKKAKKNHKEFYFIIIIKLLAVYGTPSKKNIFLSANDNIFLGEYLKDFQFFCRSTVNPVSRQFMSMSSVRKSHKRSLSSIEKK